MLTDQHTEQLGQQICKARKQQGLSQIQLASVSGVGVRFVRELEQGKASCHIGKALHVMTMLGLHFSIEADDTK